MMCDPQVIEMLAKAINSAPEPSQAYRELQTAQPDVAKVVCWVALLREQATDVDRAQTFVTLCTDAPEEGARVLAYLLRHAPAQ